nr:aminodeoxychorismate synthase component I [Polymorphobacter multimanifer]
MLDDAAAGQATLFTEPVEALSTRTLDGVQEVLARLGRGENWAGFIGFESGAALESGVPARLPPGDEPLLWFARFARCAPVVADDWLAAAPPDPAPRLGPAVPTIAAADHAAAVARIHALIAAGDIYQANLTFAAEVAVHGHPAALYRRLRAGSRAPYGALVFTGAHWLLSFSPELFFRLEGRQLTARPMKGTALRGGNAVEDSARAEALLSDPKNRAENLMIVDLLRNDLSRVATQVAVPALFEVETYPTILQMTSTITAEARPGMVAVDVLRALFPCGSITGAPKIRSLQVIGDVEPAPRGVYTGSIGAIHGNGDAQFNVAIRTLVLPVGSSTARLGLGSGIVADSDPAAEWQECLDKAGFLVRQGPPGLIETMRCEGGDLPDLDRHLARMAASAAFLGHRFDAGRVADAVRAAATGHDGRVRLLLAPSGAIAVQCGPLPPALAEPVPVGLASLPVDAADWRLRHKTSDRAFYDAARRAGGAPEVLLVRPDGLITEGSFTSLFVERGGRLLTPPLALGLLPGILRARLLAEGMTEEAELTKSDLSDGFFIGNALRGLMRAHLAR